METNFTEEKKKIILPKHHLSWSQMDLWMKNPERYRREYFENGKRLDTKYLQFGKGIASFIEAIKKLEKEGKKREEAVEELSQMHGWDDNTKEVFMRLDIFEECEFKIELEVEGVPILSFVDSYDPMFHSFREYKTGKNPWDRAKVIKHGQLLFYAVALRKKYGQSPFECFLDWIQTAESAEESDDFWAKVDKKLALTGKIQSFQRSFDEREIDRMQAAIVAVANEISEAYQKYINEI